jgi:uncharacterized membrane protein YfcA
MDLFAAINPLLVVSGFVVGMLVGLTGVGGGSLMTPILVLLFGVHATTAVGTDLLYAAITKTGGTLTHGLKGTVDWRVTSRLAAGSIPATILTLFALYILGIKGNDSPPLITTALGIALVMTAVCVLSHRWLRLLTATRHAEPDPRWTATLTTFAGLLLRVFVTLSSVGAGAIGMTALVLLYPRTPIARLVGSDIAHAVPLTLIAGVGHWLLGSVDWVLLGSLVIGSLPGIFFGSHLSARVPDKVLRPVLATILVIVAGPGDPGCLDPAGLLLRHDAPRLRPRDRRLAHPLERPAQAILQSTGWPGARTGHRPAGQIRRRHGHALELYRYHRGLVSLAG